MLQSPKNGLVISRRLMLKYAGVLVVSAYLNIRQPAAKAIGFAAVVAIAQVGIGIAGLLGPKGPSLADLIQAQTKMLKDISDQVKAVNDHLNEIDKQLDEIAALLHETPVKVVTEDRRVKINGAIAEFGLILRVYDDIKKKDGIVKARDAIKDQLGTLVLIRIAGARGELMSSYADNKALIPVIAAAMYTEIRGMIFYRTKPEWILNLMAVYRKYFEDWLSDSFSGNLPKLIQEKLQLRSELYKQAQIPLNGDPFVDEVTTNGCGYFVKGEGYFETEFNHHLKRRKFVFDLSSMTISQLNLESDVSKSELEIGLEMIKQGSLKPNESFLTPSNASYSWLGDIMSEEKVYVTSNRHDCQGSLDKSVLLGDGVTRTPVRSLQRDPSGEYKGLQKLPAVPKHNLVSIHENTREMIALRSLEVICKEAINFCIRFDREIRAADKPI
jgi:hypothetical protein